MSDKNNFIFIFGKEEKKKLDQKELESIMMLRVMGVKIEKILEQEGVDEISPELSLELIERYKKEMRDSIKTTKNKDDYLSVSFQVEL